MARHPLPVRREDVWTSAFMNTASRYVAAVDCRQGRVVAGGEELYMLRPGEQTLKSRPLPKETVAAHALAIEPRAPGRVAFADELGGVHVLGKDGVVGHLRRAAPDAAMCATHLAWGSTPNALYVRWDDGELARFRGPDLRDSEEFENIGDVSAVAADERGVVALLLMDADPTPVAGILRPGDDFDYRVLPVESPVGGGEGIAVAGNSIAVTLPDVGVFVSRSPTAELTPCEPLATAGPIAFEGSASDAALYGAVAVGSTLSLVRVDASGAAVSVVDLVSEGEGVHEAAIAQGLAWDGTRRTLWVASTTVGLVRCDAPRTKGKTPSLLS
jgi:hypothetical protein